MNKSIFILSFVLLIGFPQVSSGESPKTFQYKNDNFSITVPENWKENSKRDILEHTQETKQTIVPDYFFQVKSREPFSYPNVVITIGKKIYPREFVLKLLEVYPDQYLDPLNKKQLNKKPYRGYTSKIGKPFYDEKNSTLWIFMELFHDVIGEHIVSVSGIVLTNDGSVDVVCTTLKEESSQYVDKCISIIKSVKILNKN